MSRKQRLSPNQTLTRKFPKVGEALPSAEIGNWKLEVCGLVQTPLMLSLVEFQSLTPAERVWDTICVTGWTHPEHHWSGVMLATLLAIAKPLPEARFVRFLAYSHRGHDTSLPLGYALGHVLLADRVDGERLTLEHGAPVRTVCEGKYFYKSLKWVKQIVLLASDSLGYWERESAYHNNADPWLEQRYVERPMDKDEFARRLGDGNFECAEAIKDDQFKQLRDWNQVEWNFQGASIKACDLSKANLRNARCHKANFTLTKFTGADLSGADFSNCDCEGADFRGANLTGADFRHAVLTVARFAHAKTSIRGAKFRLEDLGNEGLGEDERAFLLDQNQGAVIR